MDLADVVDGKLDVHYDTGDEEARTRRNLKRKEKFGKQVKAAVNLMQVDIQFFLQIPQSFEGVFPKAPHIFIPSETQNSGVCSGKEVFGEDKGAILLP